MHQLCGIGNAGKDAELKQLQSGTQVAECSVALSTYEGPQRERGTIWCRLSVFGKRAEAFAQVKQGAKLWFTGRLRVGAYLRQDGTPQASVDVTVDDWGFAGAKPQEQGGGYGGGGHTQVAPRPSGGYGPRAASDPPRQGYAPADDDIPF